MANPTVAASFPRAFLDFAVSRGANRRGLIERSHLRTDDLAAPDHRVPVANYVELMKAAIELCSEPAMALHFGEAVKMQEVSIVGVIGEFAESWESSRQLINRYARLMLDEDDGGTSDRIELVPDGENVCLKFTSALYVEHPLLTESGFARCVCGARELLDTEGIAMSRPFPKAIHFTFEEPSYRAEYDRVFRIPLVFRSDMNALVMGKEFLSIKSSRTNPYLSQTLRAHAEELLKDLEGSRSTRGRVERLLIPMLHTGKASNDVIAGKLGLSRQTLFRKLKTEGVTFEKVLDELRYRLALDYLNRKKVSVKETAYLLGFSEPAAFSRAFKRWTGYSPRTMRALHPQVGSTR
jgi:AraC-like DNA-binding protein